MKIKEAEYIDETIVRKKQVSPEVFGCDECMEEIKEYPNEEMRLEMTVFYNGEDTKRLHFCSWKCTLKHLPKIESDYFISLPHLYCDTKDESKKGIQELIRLTTPLVNA